MPLQRASGALLRNPPLLIVGASVLSLLLAALTALSLWEMRTDAMDRARDAANNLALILQRDIARNIELYDLSLQAVTDGMQDPNIVALPPQIRQFVLFDRSTTARDVGSLLVVDNKGDVIVDSRSVPARHIHVGDRDYFQVHQGASDVGLYISEPFSPRINGADTSIGLSRRLNGPHGEFNGIVVGTLRLNYFHRLFEGINLGPHATVTLARSDGTLLMRRPYDEQLIGRSVADSPAFQKRLLTPEGSYVDLGAIDGVERLFSFRHIAQHRLIVSVGLATQDIYAEWWQRTWVIGGIVLVLDAVFIALSILFAGQLRRRLEMEQQLHLLANTDGLTGLGTRRALDAALDVEWRRANRTRMPLAVLMIDVDDFKHYNDRYGHAAGDTALRNVARCVNESIKRPGDFAGRYGGEEFCALLPNTDLPGAIRVAETIRAAVLACDEPNAGSARGKLTVSIGVAVHSGAATTPDDTPQDLIRMADGRLYEAKAAGRNVVIPRQERPKLAVV